MSRWIGLIVYKNKLTDYVQFDAEDLMSADEIFNEYISELEEKSNNEIDFCEISNIDDILEIEGN